MDTFIMFQMRPKALSWNRNVNLRGKSYIFPCDLYIRSSPELAVFVMVEILETVNRLLQKYIKGRYCITDDYSVARSFLLDFVEWAHSDHCRVMGCRIGDDNGPGRSGRQPGEVVLARVAS